ncbi:helix-turn-helix domain-containing protein [Dactylosporangium siamense]|uniref:ArsR family transcriptional regulator n=1 Tax=Dactylosporangium siamense TaxID=685454 RepID=A0A919UCL6_9ACTN|nr:winged helix-turn-helix domain-containing protein [Dactylosporangium siamense]GIG46931.1 ArsR family transcriptional regulator [Dactylosporangium siamense]
MRRPATDAEAKALASGVRLRIIRLCLDRALTNKEIAERLDANPATVLHHVRTLVATGFLVPQEERRGPRGVREVPYLSTTKSWDLSLGDQEANTNRAMLDAFEQELALLGNQVDAVNFARLGLRLTPEEWQELQDRFEALLDEYAQRDRTHGRPYSIFLAMYEDRSRD